MGLKTNLNSILSNFEKKLTPLNRIEVSKAAILHNFDYFQNNLPQEVWPVLKSNAYGHGIKEVVTILQARKFKYFVCDSYFEVLKIWEVAPHEVLLIGSTRPENLRFLDFRHIALMVQDFVTLKTLTNLKREIRIHLKINTGMNRQGFEMSEIPAILKQLTNSRIILEGVFSHLANADGETDNFTRRQQRQFLKAIALIKNAGRRPKYFHLAATAGAFKSNSSPFNCMRLGIGLYGFGDDNLTPALRFVSTLVKTRVIKKGEKVSYNCTFAAKHKMRIGVLPVGYYEGVDWRLSNKGFLNYEGKFLPILGRVCMNLLAVSLEGTNAKIFDEVEVISAKARDKNSISSMAAMCKTIPYEILVKLSSTIRRQVVD